MPHVKLTAQSQAHWEHSLKSHSVNPRLNDIYKDEKEKKNQPTKANWKEMHHNVSIISS